MRLLEIVAALVLAGLVFIGLKVVGLVLHIALIGALVGLVLGFAIARAFRSPS